MKNRKVCLAVWVLALVLSGNAGGESWYAPLVKKQETAPAAVEPEAAPQPSLESNMLRNYSSSGGIEKGIRDFRDCLAEDRRNDRMRFALGLLQFAHAVERLGQSWYRYGLRTEAEYMENIPVLRIPIPQNPDPETVDYPKARAVLEEFLANLSECQATLSQIKDESVALPVYLGLVRLDLNGDGQARDDESLWHVYQKIFRAGPVTTADGSAEFVIEFDAADAYWLRGYCHLLSALLEFWLAYDQSELFATTGHLFFLKPSPSHEYLKEESWRRLDQGGLPRVFFDLAALVHGISFPVKEPARMKKALEHLKQMTAMSRASWRCCVAETDNAWEWIPNSNQESVIEGAEVTPEMVEHWLVMLDEVDAILDGKKLIRFWRGEKTRGVNLSKVFRQPTRFDLVLWVQGTAADPYLEDGPITDGMFWNQLMSSFNGRFMPYAIWFN